MNHLTKPNPQSPDVRRAETDLAWNQAEPMQPYDPYWNGQTQPPQYILVDPPNAPAAQNSIQLMTRSMQNMLQMQMQMMREFEARLARVEQNRQTQKQNGNIYAQTWWALWGILMLILVSALVMVLLMILRG